MAVAKRLPSPASLGLPLRADAGEITEVRRRDALAPVPRVTVAPHRVRELPIDPRVAFVLSRIDGQSSIETLVDVTGLPTDELLSILARLVTLRAVAM